MTDSEGVRVQWSVSRIKYIKNKKPTSDSTTEATAVKKTTKNASAAAVPRANTKAKITKPAPGKTPVTSAKAKTAAKPKSAAPKARAMKSKKEDMPAADEDTDMKDATRPGRKMKATKKAAAEKPASKEADRATPAAIPSKKRKADDDEAPAPAVKKAKTVTKGSEINAPPSQRLNVYVFGEGTAGELGLGTSKLSVDVKRPRLNPNLSAETVGVVQIAAGGMHCVALTYDNKILTWGVNDQGTLGRDTDWEGGLKDMDDASDSEDDDKDDNGLNPKECLPGEVDWSQTEVAEGTRFVQVAAGDSTSFVLTDDGKVYGWGTFRSNDGIFGFTTDVKIASRPVLIPKLNKIKDIKAGANHALAIDIKGAVYAWGSGQQNQLGRRIIERTKTQALIPSEFGLPKGPRKGITAIATGSYHSFAISKNGDVYSWGLNNFGETGHMDNAGQDDAVIMNPQVVTSLQGKNIVNIEGGGHHSLAATEEGDCIIWGRVDGAQMGIAEDEIAKLPDEDVVKDDSGRIRIIGQPQKISAIHGKVVHVASASDHNLVVTQEGKAWSWGFSANYQTGLGTDDDVPVATMIDNTAVRDKKIVGATTGGQFSILTAIADDAKDA